LIEDGSVGAEERVLDGITDRQRSANVEHLASSLDVSVVTIDATNASERSDGDFVEDGIVGLWIAGNRFTEVPECDFFLFGRENGLNGERTLSGNNYWTSGRRGGSDCSDWCRITAHSNKTSQTVLAFASRDTDRASKTGCAD